MGTKKITDLQLIDAATADVSIPGDNGIQTYRLTVQQLMDFILANGNITLPMLDDDLFTGLTGVTPANDDYFPLIDTSDSNKTKKGLVGSFRNSTFRSVTSTDTAGASDEVLVHSGASFTQTLPANGTIGRKLKLVHNGTSLSQVYTFATQGGATIGGIASGSFAHYTTGETTDLLDDGTNWIIVGRRTNIGPVALGAIPFVGTGGAITKGSSPSLDQYSFSRNGRFATLIYTFACANSGTANGDLLFPTPTGMTFDTTDYKTYNTGGSGGFSTAAGIQSLMNGNANLYTNTFQDTPMGAMPYLYSNTQFRLAGMYFSTSGGNATSRFIVGNTAFGTDGPINYKATVTMPISGWQP